MYAKVTKFRTSFIDANTGNAGNCRYKVHVSHFILISTAPSTECPVPPECPAAAATTTPLVSEGPSDKGIQFYKVSLQTMSLMYKKKSEVLLVVSM